MYRPSVHSISQWGRGLHLLDNSWHSGFSQTHKIGNIGINANLVFPYIWSFLLYLQHIMLVNNKLCINGCNRITFQGCRLYWSSSYLMAQLKWSWQYCYFCIVEILSKTVLQALIALKGNIFTGVCVSVCLGPIWPLPTMRWTSL